MSYTIEREVRIEAPVDVVWRTVTEPDQMLRWFSQEAALDARPGADGTLTFRSDRGVERVVRLSVVAVERPHVFSFRWNHPEGSAALASNSTLVTFRFFPEGPERTRLRVEETGLESVEWADDHKQDYADEHRRGWETLAGRLRELLAGAGP